MVRQFWQENTRKLPRWAATPKNWLVAAGVLLLVVIATFFIISGSDPDEITNRPTVDINKSYEIIARTEERQRTTGRFTLTVTDAQFADSILVQGKRARPVKGKVFLVLNMEITNPHKVPLYAFPVDLFRLVRSDGKKFAPSTHQGGVQVRPEATKKSNVAFVIFPSEKKFKIEMGDVNEPKETLEITFK